MDKSKKKKWLAGILGIFGGLVNGFFGSGGGIIAVQSLEQLEIREKNAHATSLFVIFPLSLVSAVVYLLSGNITFDINTVFLLVGAGGGGFLGALLLGKIKTEWINMIFTILILASGIRMMF